MKKLSLIRIIEYDFENVFGGTFKVEDYRPNSTKTQRQIIALTEHVNSNGEIELYFYLYNPKQVPILNTGENKITLSYSTGTVKFEQYQKYDIEQIDARYFSTNVASKTNASLVKYKVSGFALSTEETLRAYSISELELRLTYGVFAHTVAKTYTFNENTDGTLDVITGGQSVIEIDNIGHTFYRVQSGDVGKYNDIRTVYFAVEKDVVNKYGLMDSVNVTWQEKNLQPMLLLDDKAVLSEFQSILGQTDLSDFKYSFGAGMRPGLITGTSLNIGHLGTEFKYGFNTSEIPDKFYDGTNYYFGGIVSNFVWSEHFHQLNVGDLDGESYDSIIDKLYFAFYCDYEDNPRVSGETLLEAVDKYDGKIDGAYSDELFTSSVDYNVTYNIGQESDVKKYEIDTNIIKYVLNGWQFTTKEVGDVEFSRFEQFDEYSYEKDYEEIKEALKDNLFFDYEQVFNNALSAKYLIDINDIENFREFVEENDDCYIYFIRYSVTDTYIEEAAVFGDTTLKTGIDVIDNNITQAECYACNGSLVHTTLVNDFDIITLGFDDLRGGYVTVPVSSAPTDVIPDVSQIEKKLPPEREESNFEKLFEVLKTIATVVIAIVSTVIVSMIVLIVVLTLKIVKRKRGKNSEKKNN